jgi:hypothetical protein
VREVSDFANGFCKISTVGGSSEPSHQLNLVPIMGGMNLFYFAAEGIDYLVVAG